ncbi:MAG: trypsin-like peptidase domain-containing protein [Saprospiraceae bacterium]|nr:trypsin-like peptidase domain-containing protein [Saprospiraceae bacterium]
MAIAEVIEQLKLVIVQIATPYNTGTGFLIPSENLIVTNEHVVRDNRRVVVNGSAFDKQIVDVLFLDSKLDLAFLASPRGLRDSTDVPLLTGRSLDEGESVLAIGHPYGLKFTTTNGIISNAAHHMQGIRYLQHDAALNPGNSGGPLVTHQGEIAGVNTFIVKDGNNIGFSLPAALLREALDDYLKIETRFALRCSSCSNILSEKMVEDQYCTICGTKAIFPNKVDEYEAVGVNKTIETTLTQLGHDVELARIGPNHWQINEGSAKITMAYHEDSGLIIGDAVLADLPRANIKPIYNYLLRQNYHLENLSLSVRGNEIILSLIIFDRYLNVETAAWLMKHLFRKADYYDNILVEEYGAMWKEVT